MRSVEELKKLLVEKLGHLPDKDQLIALKVLQEHLSKQTTQERGPEEARNRREFLQSLPPGTTLKVVLPPKKP